MNKNYIFILSSSQAILINIIDAFPDDYTINEKINLDDFKAIEEEKIIKRFEFFPMYPVQDWFYGDFSWDRYNKIYLSENYNSDSGELSGELHYIDPIKSMSNKEEVDEKIENVEELKAAVTSMVLTQRYLICALSNGNVALVNMFLPDKDLKEYKNTLGSSYQKLVVDKELEVAKLTSTNDYIISMCYDMEFKKIWQKQIKIIYLFYF